MCGKSYVRERGKVVSGVRWVEETVPEMVNCDSCGAEIQQGWKAYPTCGNRVDASAGASLNITDAVASKVDQSQTVDRSVPIGWRRFRNTDHI